MSLPELEPVRFGLIADVQYARKRDQGERRFERSLARLEQALEQLAARAELDFVVQLGDLIDGRASEALSLADLRRVTQLFEQLEVPLVHVIGNHCLSLPRARLQRELGLESGRRSFALRGTRLLVLDTMELSTLGSEAGTPAAEAARAWLDAHPREQFPQASAWNGGLGQAQRDWLATELRAAAAAGERSLVFAHHPLLVEVASPSLLAWDAQPVLELLEREPAPLAWISGHAHAGGYTRRAGVHHLTLEGMVEAPLDSNAWAVVELGRGELRVEGQGCVPSRILPI